MLFDNLKYRTHEEWLAIRALADDRTIVIKRPHKEPCVVVWNRMDYLLEAKKK